MNRPLRLFTSLVAPVVTTLIMASAALAQGGPGTGPSQGQGTGGPGSGPMTQPGPMSGAGPAVGYGQGIGFGPGGATPVIANTLGMTQQDLLAARLAGTPIVTLAQQRNVDFDRVVSAVMAAHRELVQARVTAGDLTDNQAAWLLAEMELRLRTQLQSNWGFGPPLGVWTQAYGPSLLQQAATTFGMTPVDLLTQLQSGKSLAQLAQERNLDSEEALVQPFLTRERDQLQDQVRLHLLDQTQADAIQARDRDQLHLRIQTPGTGMYCLCDGTGGGFGLGAGAGDGYGAWGP
jgi:hypothetical protein